MIKTFAHCLSLATVLLISPMYSGTTLHEIVYTPCGLIEGEAGARSWGHEKINILPRMLETGSGGLTVGALHSPEMIHAWSGPDFDINLISQHGIVVSDMMNVTEDDPCYLRPDELCVLLDLTSSTVSEIRPKAKARCLVAACIYSVLLTLQSENPVAINVCGTTESAELSSLSGRYQWSSKRETVVGGVGGFDLERTGGVYRVVPGKKPD